MSRLPDWHARLSATVAEAAEKPFSWVDHYCALFAADGVLAMTGEDLAAPWRGAVTDEAGALALLGTLVGPGADIADLAATLLPEIAPAEAAPGDVVAVVEAEGLPPALGIVQGPLAVYVVGPGGLALIGREKATRAFRVD